MKKLAAAALAGSRLASTPRAGRRSVRNRRAADVDRARRRANRWSRSARTGTSAAMSAPASTTRRRSRLPRISAPPPGNAATPISADLGANGYSTNFTVDHRLWLSFQQLLPPRRRIRLSHRPGRFEYDHRRLPLQSHRADQSDAGRRRASTSSSAISTTRRTPATASSKSRNSNNMGLTNGYVDLGTYWGVTPYVGAGVGVNANTMSGNLAYFQTLERRDIRRQPDADRNLSADLDRPIRQCDQPEAEHRLHTSKTGTGRSARRNIPPPGR